MIDVAILTHPHDDHYPGLDGIRRHFDVLRYYDPGFPKGGVEYPAYLAAMQSETVAGGDLIQTHMGLDQFGDLDYLRAEVSAEFLYAWPGEDADDDLGSRSTLENNASIVLRLEYGDHVFLFMGDAEGKDQDDAPTACRHSAAGGRCRHRCRNPRSWVRPCRSIGAETWCYIGIGATVVVG